MTSLQFKGIHKTGMLMAAALLLTTGLAGCSSNAPCLQYQPQSFTRTVHMRGYGFVQTQERTMVCTLRGDTGDTMGTHAD